METAGINGATGLGLPSLVLTAQLELNQEQEEGILQESGAKSGAGEEDITRIRS